VLLFKVATLLRIDTSVLLPSSILASRHFSSSKFCWFLSALFSVNGTFYALRKNACGGGFGCLCRILTQRNIAYWTEKGERYDMCKKRIDVLFSSTFCYILLGKSFQYLMKSLYNLFSSIVCPVKGRFFGYLSSWVMVLLKKRPSRKNIFLCPHII